MKGCKPLAALLALALAALGWAAEPVAAPTGSPPALLLACTPTGEGAVHLQLVVLNTGSEVMADATVQVSFAAAAGGPALELPPAGPRTMLVPLRSAGWAVDQVELVSLGEVSLAPPCPEVLDVQAGLRGQAPQPLGRLRRGGNGEPPAFARAYPEALAPSRPGEPSTESRRTGLVFVAAYEPLDDRQFQIRLACFNCGDTRAADEDLFLHFELAPTGTDLLATTALGLLPAARLTDSAGWHAGDLAVVPLGPFSTSASLPEFIYLRAGLYNRQGDGARARVDGPDDSNRALLGRLVTRQGRTWFERAPLPGSRLPVGWSTATGGQER